MMIAQMLLLLFIAVTVALSSSDELNGAIVDPVKIEGTVVFLPGRRPIPMPRGYLSTMFFPRKASG